MIKLKKHPSLVIASIFLLFWLIFALIHSIKTSDRNAGDFNDIKKGGILRVCVEENPFNCYLDETGRHGFHFELIKGFANNHNLNLIFIFENDLQHMLHRLEKNECDLIVGQIPITSDLKKSVQFTIPIIESRMMLLQRKSTKIRPNSIVKNIMDFGGKNIYTNDHLAQINRLHHLASEIGDTIHIRKIKNASNERLTALVAAGLIDYAVLDFYIAHSFLKKYTSVDVSTPIGFHQQIAWATSNKKNILLESLNVYLDSTISTQGFSDLKKHYQIID